MRKTTIGIGENKAADQLCSDCQTWSETRIVRFLMHGSCFVSRSEGPLTPPHMIPASPTDHEHTGMIPQGFSWADFGAHYGPLSQLKNV